MGIVPKPHESELTMTRLDWLETYLIERAKEKRRRASEKGKHWNGVSKRRRRTKLAKAQKRRV